MIDAHRGQIEADRTRLGRISCRWLAWLGAGLIVLALGTVATLSVAPWAMGQQQEGRRGRRNRGYQRTDDRGGVPTWELDKRHHRDVFTFVRARYTSGGGWRGGKWDTDYPDSDLNFSYRLQELTSLQVDPNGLILDLDDPRLVEYPFLYLIEPGEMNLTEPEVLGLRKFLERGGFLMVDDFWGEDEWDNFYREFKRVLPGKEPVELGLEHEIFHIVYDLKEKPLVPSIHAWWSGHLTERWDAQEPHYRAVMDERGRMMALICHNTDLGDGWEREGLDHEYFELYSEKWSYPMGINIIVYAMTH